MKHGFERLSREPLIAEGNAIRKALSLTAVSGTGQRGTN
jgi:hypothetical protein